MLQKQEFEKFIKPLLTILISKPAIFLSIVIIIVANHQIGFFSDNPNISHCDTYHTQKISQYQKNIQITTFLMALFGALVSGINVCSFLLLYIRIRKHQNSRLESDDKLSQNRLRCHFVVIFIESICILNIFFRFIERLKQQSVCNLSGESYFIIVTIFSSLLLCILITNYVFLFRILALFKMKIRTLEELSIYSDQMTLKQNLFFNKNGYIKEIYKMQNCTTPSHSLKDGVIKNFPSGFKKNKFSSTRQIIFRLRGGNKNQNQNILIKVKKISKNEDQIDQFQNDPNQETLDSKRDLKKKYPHHQEIHKLNLLSVNQKIFKQSPNEQNLQSIQTALNVIQLSINNQREILRSKDQNSSQDNSIQQKHGQSHRNGGLFKVKKVQFDSFPQEKNKQNQKIIQKNDKPISIQVKEEEQLKQRFNLTPNVETRKNYQALKNYQNIDHNDNYYVVDVDRIKKKTKFLTSNNLDDHDNIDPNLLYSKGTWVPKKKRIGKKHEKNVQEYLQKRSKINKQEMLCQEDEQSSYSESFEADSLSSQIQDSSSQEQKKDDSNNVDNLNHPESEKDKQKKVTELCLYLKRRKNLHVQNKLKLFEDQEGFYDEQDEQAQSSQEDSQLQRQRNNGVQIFQIYDKPVRQQSIEKIKLEQKIHLKNKQLETQQARMLRFIRKKYIETNQLKQQIRQKSHVVFANQEQNSMNKEMIQGLNQQNN